MGFTEELERGLAGEAAIATWLRGREWYVLPAYENIISHGKGPRLYAPKRELIAPDFLVFRGDKCFWIEAKRKTAFAWHRVASIAEPGWVTGIDLRHYVDYCRVDDETPYPVWLLFLHEGGQAKDSPPDSPAGLFGQTLGFLRRNEHHRHENWGESGMVYWGIEKLLHLAELCEVLPT